ncbi:DUF5326 family protein [Streptomyces sp. NPDC050418]|uniref:DUF5326 family protein n=1 Tax=Streptomyces sp. NPDC050418 TaxID=3365612 RepID=UPI0037B6A2C6
MKDILAGMPWWVKWIAIPVLALVVFGSLLWSLIGFVVGLLFKVLVFAALVGGLIYLVRKFKEGSGSGSRSEW